MIIFSNETKSMNLGSDFTWTNEEKILADKYFQNWRQICFSIKVHSHIILTSLDKKFMA